MDCVHWVDIYQPKKEKINSKDGGPDGTHGLIDIHRNTPSKTKLPPGIKLKIYNFPRDVLDTNIVDGIIEFNNDHNKVGKYNTNIIDKDFVSKVTRITSCLALLFEKGEIIGTMISISFRTIYEKENPLNTSYTTNLCIHPDYRNKGLAISLIGGIIRSGANERKVYHGYYLSEFPHQKNNTIKIESWYRPICHTKIREAGYKLPKYTSEGGRLNHKFYYHIDRSEIINEKIKNPTRSEYDSAMGHFEKRSLYLSPTLEEFGSLCDFFDVYLFSRGILFLMSSEVKNSKTDKKIKKSSLVYMSGDLLGEALRISKETDQDLLAGFYFGDITEKTVEENRGHKTISVLNLELYNSPSNIEISKNNFHLPIF
jgi:hypothetical protein